MKKLHLTETGASALAHICMIAAERFDECAEEFRKLVDHVPDPNSMMQIHGAGAQRLVDQFEGQAAQARKFMNVFQNADGGVIDYIDDEEEDD